MGGVGVRRLLGPSTLPQVHGASDLRAASQRGRHAHVRGVGSEVSVSAASEEALPALCRRPHLCTVWNCPGRGDSAGGPRGRACPPRGWGASYMPESCGTAPGTRHRETTVPMGSRRRPLCQEDRIMCLRRPWGPSLLGLEQTREGSSPGHVERLGQVSFWCWGPASSASPGHGDPPCRGAGQAQALERVLVWPLQGWEQAVHSDHRHQLPGTVGDTSGRRGTAVPSAAPALSATLAASLHLPASWVRTWAR